MLTRVKVCQSEKKRGRKGRWRRGEGKRGCLGERVIRKENEKE